MEELNTRIRTAKHAPLKPGISAKAKGFLRRALCVEVSERADAPSLTQRLVEQFSLDLPAAEH
jgi:hypothetical protein